MCSILDVCRLHVCVLNFAFFFFVLFIKWITSTLLMCASCIREIHNIREGLFLGAELLVFLGAVSIFWGHTVS